jgi:hypothetical protein
MGNLLIYSADPICCMGPGAAVLGGLASLGLTDLKQHTPVAGGVDGENPAHL